MAFVVQDATTFQVLEDGKRVGGIYPNPPNGGMFYYAPPASPTFSADGRHLAFAAFDGKSYQVVIDGKAVSSKYKAINQVDFSPDNKHYAFTAQLKTGEEVLQGTV